LVVLRNSLYVVVLSFGCVAV